MSSKNNAKDHRTLIFSPHPDDAEIAMGGAMARFLDEGWDVCIVDITDGEPTAISQKAFSKIMTSLNTLRAPIAHCCILAEDEVVRLKLAVKDWFRLME